LLILFFNFFLSYYASAMLHNNIFFLFIGAAYSWSCNFQKWNLQEGAYKVEQNMGLIKNGFGTTFIFFFFSISSEPTFFFWDACGQLDCYLCSFFPHCARTALGCQMHQHIFEANQLLQFYKWLNYYSMLWGFQQPGNYQLPFFFPYPWFIFSSKIFPWCNHHFLSHSGCKLFKGCTGIANF